MDRFPVLGVVSFLLRLIGWIIAVVAMIMFIVGLSGGTWILFDRVSTAVGGIVVLMNGLIVVAAGEAIGVMFAIEMNTRPPSTGRIMSD